MKCSIFRNKKKKVQKVGATGVPEVSRVPSGEVMDHHLNSSREVCPGVTSGTGNFGIKASIKAGRGQCKHCPNKGRKRTV